jgi:hypothetical protein
VFETLDAEAEAAREHPGDVTRSTTITSETSSAHAAVQDAPGVPVQRTRFASGSAHHHTKSVTVPSKRNAKWFKQLAGDSAFVQRRAASAATRRIQRAIARMQSLSDVQMVRTFACACSPVMRFIFVFCFLQQISALESVKLEHVHAAAAAIVASRPESQLRVPFGQLLVTLGRWKFGLDALTSVERLHRESSLAGWVRHMLAARLQCVVRGFLARLSMSKQSPSGH